MAKPKPKEQPPDGSADVKRLLSESSSDDDLPVIAQRKSDAASKSSQSSGVSGGSDDQSQRSKKPTRIAKSGSDDRLTAKPTLRASPWSTGSLLAKPKPTCDDQQTSPHLRAGSTISARVAIDTKKPRSESRPDDNDLIVKAAKQAAAQASASSDEEAAPLSGDAAAQKKAAAGHLHPRNGLQSTAKGDDDLTDSPRPLRTGGWRGGSSDEPQPGRRSLQLESGSDDSPLGQKALSAASGALQRRLAAPLPDSGSDDAPAPTDSGSTQPRVAFRREPVEKEEEEEEEQNEQPAQRKHLTAEEILTKYRFSDSDGDELEGRTSAPRGERPVASDSDSD
jgi:hypothetical protein